MERRDSEGDANKRKSRLSRSLSATRNFFKNRENFDKSENEDEIRPPPETPEPDRSVHSSKPSFSHLDSDSESDSPTEKSFEHPRREREERKSRWSERSERDDNYRSYYNKNGYSRQNRSESRKQREKVEKNRQKKLEAEQIEFTRSNPLGSALLDIVADNMALHKKLNFKESNLRIGDLCSAFHKHMEGEKDKIMRELKTSSEQTEMRILNKELQAYNCKEENLPAPKEFSAKNILTTPGSRSDAIKIFPTKHKFNGTEHTNGMNIHEFLSLINAAQKQMKLSREEFLEFLLMCTTGRPHILIKDWSENGDDIESIYYNLFTHYDMRMSPETAREKLYAFKARKNSSLSKVISDIMQLALRAACVHPQGVARTASYNNDAVQALIRCLPPIASDTASNKYHTISSKLQRPATFVELSRALSVKSHTIDAEIANSGVAPNFDHEGKTPHGNNNSYAHRRRNKNPMPHMNTAFAVNTQEVQHKEGQNSAQSGTNSHWQDRQQGQKANALYTQHPPNHHYNNEHSEDRSGNSGNYYNNDRKAFYEGNENTNAYGYGPVSGKRRNNGYQGNRQGFVPKDYCSLCGFRNHLAIDGCPNIMDDLGKTISVLPCQNTCPDCPGTVQPRLNHSAAYCPFRISGPLHGTK
jgi:hypothetical protein